MFSLICLIKVLVCKLAYSDHSQESYFGLRTYDIRHKSGFANLLFNSIFETPFINLRQEFSLLMMLMMSY